MERLLSLSSTSASSRYWMSLLTLLCILLDLFCTLQAQISEDTICQTYLTVGQITPAPGNPPYTLLNSAPTYSPNGNSITGKKMLNISIFSVKLINYHYYLKCRKILPQSKQQVNTEVKQQVYVMQRKLVMSNVIILYAFV